MPAFNSGAAAFAFPVSSDYRIAALQGDLSGGGPQVWLSQSLTYSFPSGSAYFDGGLNYGRGEISAGWAPLNATQQAAVRKVLAAWSAVANITFTEVADGTSVGDLRFAFTSVIKAPTTGHAYTPFTDNAEAGDVWIRSSLANQTFGANPAAQSYSRDAAINYHTLIHEIGHALGLSHPFAAAGESRGTAPLPAAEDSLRNTVMSYGRDGYGNYAVPTTPMPYDILAMQYLYGTNFQAFGGNTTHTLDVDNVNFMTIWDAWGIDTLVASNTRGVNQSQSGGARIDLREGAGSSIGFASEGFATTSQLVGTSILFPMRNNSANVYIAYGCVIENAVGTSANDTIIGNAVNNVLTPGLGQDTIDGGAGLDTVVMDAARGSYSVTRSSGGGLTVTRTGGGQTDNKNLSNIERLKFTDQGLAFDIIGSAGMTAKILGAVFGKASVSNKDYAGIGLSLLDGGMSYEALMQAAINAKLGANASNTAVVNLLYTNVVGTAPGPAELALYKGLLDNGSLSQAGLGIAAAEHSLNQSAINLTGLANSGLAYL